MGRFLLIVFLLASIISYAGTEQKVNHFLKLSNSFITNNIDSSKYYMALCKQKLDSVENKDLWNEYYYTLAKIELETHNLKQASYLFHKLIKSFKTQKKLNNVANCYYYLAKTNFKNSDYTSSIKNALEAKTLYDSLQMLNQSYACSSLIGSIFFHLEQYYLAKEYFFEVEKYALKFNDEELLLSTYNNLANIYMLDSLPEHAKAINYINKAIIIGGNISSKNLGTMYLNLSNMLIQENKLDSAEYYLNKALKLTSNNDPYILSKIYFYYGIINEEKKDFKQSKKWFEKSVNTSSTNLDLISLRESYMRISNIQLKNENYKEAYKNLEKSNAYNDTILREEHLHEINKLVSIYQNENKSHKINTQNARIIAQEIKIRNQKYKNIGLVVLLSIVSLAVLIIIFYSNKLKQLNKSLKNSNDLINEKNKQLEQTVKTRDKLISTLAHDIKNPLGAISGFADLAIKSSDKLSTALYIKQIYNSSLKLYNLLNDIVAWGKSQKNLITASPEKISVSELVNHSFKIFQEMADENEIKLINVCSMKHVIKADKYTLSTAIRNLINNAIKFTNKGGEIIVRSEQIKDKTYIHIMDNGVGISKVDIPKLFDQNINKDSIGNHHNKGTGIGLVLSNEFIKLNHGTITVRSKKDKGSCFTICLPANQIA